MPLAPAPADGWILGTSPGTTVGRWWDQLASNKSARRFRIDCALPAGILNSQPWALARDLVGGFLGLAVAAGGLERDPVVLALLAQLAASRRARRRPRSWRCPPRRPSRRPQACAHPPGRSTPTARTMPSMPAPSFSFLPSGMPASVCLLASVRVALDHERLLAGDLDRHLGDLGRGEVEHARLHPVAHAPATRRGRHC